MAYIYYTHVYYDTRHYYEFKHRAITRTRSAARASISGMYYYNTYNIRRSVWLCACVNINDYGSKISMQIMCVYTHKGKSVVRIR